MLNHVETLRTGQYAPSGVAVFWDCAVQFNGKVGDTTARIDLIRPDDGLGGANVQAGAAIATVFRRRLVDSTVGWGECANPNIWGFDMLGFVPHPLQSFRSQSKKT
jgi:hypothetical protein